MLYQNEVFVCAGVLGRGEVEPFQQYSHGRCLMTMMMDLDLLLVMKSLDWKLLGIYGWEGLDGN